MLGAGPWGRNYLRTVAAMPGVELAGVGSRNPETAALVPSACRLYDDWREAIHDPGVDAVAVVTSASQHAVMATEVLEAGRPVLVEKPVALSVADAAALVDLASRRGGIAHVNHIDLVHPAVARLRAELPLIGGFAGLEMVLSGPGAVRADCPPLWDFGPHAIALCLDLAGEVLAVEDQGESGRGDHRFSIVFAGGLRARLTCGNGAPVKRRRLIAEGPLGRLIYDDCAAAKLVHRDAAGQERALPILDRRTPLECRLARFADAVRRGSEDWTDLVLGRRVVEVLQYLHPLCGVHA